MYSQVLVLHSLLRWVVLVLAVLAAARGLMGWLGKKGWTSVDGQVGKYYVLAFDTQWLIGLVLYFALSPLTMGALENMGVAMKDSVLRFWAVEHFAMMTISLVLAHVGRAISKRAHDAGKAHRMAGIFYSLALLALLAGIPWPGRPFGRPLWPF